MARAALGWSLSDLAAKAGVGRASAARFELGESVSNNLAGKLRAAFEGAGVRFIGAGKNASGVVPPP